MSSSTIHGTTVLDRLRELEQQKQAIEVEQLGLIAQVESECLAYDLGAKTTAVLLRDALHISARDAAGRVRLALAVTPRHTLTGEPAHPQTAAALAQGAISRLARRPRSSLRRTRSATWSSMTPVRCSRPSWSSSRPSTTRTRWPASPTACTHSSIKTAPSATSSAPTVDAMCHCTAARTVSHDRG